MVRKLIKKEAEKFKVNVGKLIATNGYWATSRDQSCALIFANNVGRHTDFVAVLFEIKCDLMDQNDSTIFADIAELSQFQIEEEVLFDAGSIFQIEKIREETKDDTELYVVELRTTGEGREVAKKYIKEIRQEMEYESPRMMLGILLKRLGRCKKSLEYYEQLLKNPGEEKMSHIHNRIGIALKIEHKYDLALEHFDQAYEWISESNPLERVYLAHIRHNQGQIYVKQRKNSKALMYYQEAVDIVKKEKGDINRYIAEFYSSIGRLYSNWNDYETAMVYQRKALEIRELCFSWDNVILAFTYADIGNIFLSQKNYKQALAYHSKALELRQKYLLPNHHNTAWSLRRVGNVYYANSDLKSALEYYLKSVEMTRKCPSPSQHYIVLSILEDIAFLHGYNSEKALEYRFEALEVQKKTEPINYSYLARILDKIALTYKSMNKKKDSLRFYQEALQIRKEKLSNNDFNLSYSFNNLASLYEEMGDMASALQYYREALEIYKHHCSYHDKLCTKTRNNIIRVRRWLP
jgi:tetratricopeptide (TPR) repeat protein